MTTTFMAVATFSPEHDLPQMTTVIAEEQAQVERLRAEGLLAAIHVAASRGRVFLEVRADDEDAARAAVCSLPMARWWDIDLYATSTPPGDPA